MIGREHGQVGFLGDGDDRQARRRLRGPDETDVETRSWSAANWSAVSSCRMSTLTAGLETVKDVPIQAVAR